jgi:serine/threonine protein kinase
MATDLMPTELFLEQYRLTTTAGGKPVEIGRNGPAITYRASDQESGVPVALTIVPIDSVDPAEREGFEEKARTAMRLRHINIAKTLAFGTTDDSFLFVSEYPPGETVEAWVRTHGPMPPDAVLRIAHQVVAAVGTASFHELNHPAIQPANLVIVTGKTAAGGWPLVKLTHFALSGFKSALRHAEPDLSASDFASPEQLLQGKVDFRSEIYSLGATMCFLLTGVFYSAYPRSPQTKRFARPLRTLIAHTLEDDPAERPQDPVLFAEELRACLAAIERREELRRRFGIPFSPLVTKPPRKRRIRQAHPTPLLATVGQTSTAPPTEVVRHQASRWRPALAMAGGVLALGLIAALFLPEDVVTAALHRNKTKPIEAIGVPVGVPDAARATVQPNPSASTSSPQNSRVVAAPANNSNTPVEAASSAGQAANNSNQPAGVPVTDRSAAPPPPVVAEQNATVANDSAAPSAAPQLANKVEPAAPPIVASNAPSAPPEPAAPPATRTESALPTATPATVAVNKIAPEPAPPAELEDENAGDRPNEQSTQNESVERPRETTADASTDSETISEKGSGSSKSSAASKSRTRKSPVVAQHRASSSRTRVPRALPAEPDSEPARGGTVRARVVRVTPAGNVILEMPSGEQAIVSPQDAEAYSGTKVRRHRPRRVIIERRVVVPAPYQPFLPPDA